MQNLRDIVNQHIFYESGENVCSNVKQVSFVQGDAYLIVDFLYPRNIDFLTPPILGISGVQQAKE